MDRKRALARLPEKYAAALRLLDRGVSSDEIATALELEPEAVALLLRLARAKLVALAEDE